MPGTSETSYTGLTLTALPSAAEGMARIVVALAEREGAVRLLDLGCGSGDHARAVALRLPAAEVLGLDISPANIARARAHSGGDGVGGRLDFVAADYLDYACPPFDLIFSEGVLHLIPAATPALAAKLARDVRPGGLLAVVMAHDCAVNTLIVAMRRCLRALRAPWLDAAILWMAERIYRGVDSALLRERLPYMYCTPERLDGAGFRAALTAAGFDIVDTAPWPTSSAAKLRHRLSVWRRRD